MMNRKISVAIVGINGLPANYGGFETLANYLTKYSKSNIQYTVFCSNPNYLHKLSSFNSAKLVYLPFRANGYQSIIYDILSLIIAIKNNEVLLVLGTPGAIIFPLIKMFSNRKLIVNFGGLEWKRTKWSRFKRMYLKFGEYISVMFSDSLVVDNKSFQEYIKTIYGKECKLIEYGGDHAQKINPKKDDYVKYPFLNIDYAVSVSRAQPDNNIHIVLEAYSRVSSKNIVLISNWDKSEYGRRMRKKYSGYKNIILLDAIYDLNDLNLVRSNAYLYIHSHSFCGTAPSLVEAMNLGLPVFSYKSDTNLATTEKHALFFRTTENLVTLIETTSNDTLRKIGKKMFGIAKLKYTWKRIVELYEHEYLE